MAARQSVMRSAPKRPDLDKLIENARRTGVSDEELQQQRASFAYGNAPVHVDRITKKSVVAASKRNRLTAAA